MLRAHSLSEVLAVFHILSCGEGRSLARGQVATDWKTWDFRTQFCLTHLFTSLCGHQPVGRHRAFCLPGIELQSQIFIFGVNRSVLFLRVLLVLLDVDSG